MSNPIDQEDVWDVFADSHFIYTRSRGRLHLPTEESTIDDPEGRCDRTDEAAELKPRPTEAYPRGYDDICKFCLADVNDTLDELHPGGPDPKGTRARMGEIVESQGGTPP